MNIKFDFGGKNFVIVGASSGIGRQTALELVESGANVLAVGRNSERLKSLKDTCPQKIFTVSLDVLKANQDDWSDALTNFVSNCGKIDGAVYSAGIVGATPLNSFDAELAHKIFDTSFWGMINFVQVAAKKKFSNAASSFVLMSSITSAGFGTKGLFAYTAAKSAVTGVLKPLAKEIIRNRHRINAVSPAMVKTEMVATAAANFISEDEISRYLLGIGKADDVSGMILFLLSDRASWITGQNFLIDGGYSIN